MVQPQCRVETQPFESQQLKNNQKPSNPRLPHPPVNPCCNHPRWLSTHMIYNTLEHCRRLDASCEALRRVISRVKELVRNVTAFPSNFNEFSLKCCAVEARCVK